MSLFQIQLAGESPAPAAAIPEFHVIEGKQRVLLAVNGSRLYLAGGRLDDSSLFDEIRALPSGPPVAETMAQPAALSLNIAQSCNLACSYCYAEEGRFGGAPKWMTIETAKQAIRRHIRQAVSKQVSVGFIGGEPLLNRAVLHESVRCAVQEAALRGIAITFGITTNGTLLRDSDLDLFRSYPFAVTVSLDGGRESHDALRPTVHGQGSFEPAIAAIAPLLANPGKARVSARVTVTRKNMDIGAHIAALAAAGFQEAGVSPMRTGPDPELQIAVGDWPALLARMQAAALADWRRANETGGRLRFSNFSTALRQLYRGACNALPCGAAASYVSLSADGRYYTCHRTIGDSKFDLGDLDTGPSRELRTLFAASRAVDRQEPCRSCWARYLCGGGCHAEVMRIGREGCDAIRGWLEFCISLYPEVLAERPDLLRTGPPPSRAAFGGYIK
jgi:uncharacterized protein